MVPADVPPVFFCITFYIIIRDSDENKTLHMFTTGNDTVYVMFAVMQTGCRKIAAQIE